MGSAPPSPTTPVVVAPRETPHDLDVEAADPAALLGQALAIAARAHAGATDRNGEPYLAHPLRVAARVVAHGHAAVAAALLHDVLEDTDVTPAGLAEAGIPARVVTAVEALTRLPDEPYPAAVERAAADPLARVVKRADLADNLAADRLARLDPAVRARLVARYEPAAAWLDALP